KFKTYTTTGPGDAVRLTKLAVSEGAGLVVCVGGDGTFNEVVNGLMELEKSVRADTVLGFVPDGTGCDFVKTLPIPVDIEKAIRLIASGPSRLIDVGRLVFMNQDGFEKVRYFHNIASMGLGGEVDRRVNNTTKRFGSFISFIWATLCSILLDGKKKICLHTDQGPALEVNSWNVAVANGRYHGGGMLVAP
ncbi:MAG: diacylglycerol kinase family lipid kinase, partial [Planctomycetes bacterium]|nr:diacylglycerol kinase family lipid kinase [Planctomycetota bacterium]